MNTRTKAQLKLILKELGEIYESELKANKKHTRAGEEAYAAHAAWCADGIQEAIMLLENKFPVEAVALLQSIVASAPTDNLVPHSSVKPSKKKSRQPAGCANGSCNHPEHM